MLEEIKEGRLRYNHRVSNHVAALGVLFFFFFTYYDSSSGLGWQIPQSVFVEQQL